MIQGTISTPNDTIQIDIHSSSSGGSSSSSSSSSSREEDNTREQLTQLVDALDTAIEQSNTFLTEVIKKQKNNMVGDREGDCGEKEEEEEEEDNDNNNQKKRKRVD